MRPLLGGRTRALKFALVGALCFAVQYLALLLLARTGLVRPLADGAGFLLSAQLNFALSTAFTWRDRRGARARGLVARWASFNLTALLGLAINTGVFSLLYPSLGNLAASALGVLAGAGCNYLVLDLLVFRRRPAAPAPAPHAAVRLPLPAKEYS